MSLIARLIEAGTPADLIEEVAMLLAEQKVLDKRRAAERERQARHRVSRDITLDNVTPVTSQDDPPLSPPNEIKSNPPHTPPDHSTRARKGHRLPSDWQPKPLTPEVAAIVARWPPGAIERELARFRDWAASATGQVAVKNDWDAAWRNWLRKRDEEGLHRTANGTGNHQRGFAGNSTMQSIAERIAAE